VLNNLSEAFLTHLLDVNHEDREAFVDSNQWCRRADLLGPVRPAQTYGRLRGLWLIPVTEPAADASGG
jgi:hypothetical protein